MSTARVIANPPDVTYLDARLLDGNGQIKLLPAATYQEIDPLHLSLWCMFGARYCVPTVELVDWLRERIAGRKALEIGAGNGDLHRHLGIAAVDSYHQWHQQEVREYYQALGQSPTRPAAGVLQLDANDAVRLLKPEVVVGAWITHRWTGGEVGNMNGPIEEKILDGCQCYIHIGNGRVHGSKPILALPHQKYQFPWLVSRASVPEENAIWVWERP